MRDRNTQSFILAYDPNEPETTPVVTVKSEPTTDFAQSGFPTNVFGGTEIVKNVYDKNRIVENVVYTNEAANINKPRRPKRAPAKKKKPKIQDENISDEEEKVVPHQQDVYRLKNDVVVMIHLLMMPMMITKDWSINVDYFTMEKQ